VDFKECLEVVRYAIRSGVNVIDTAPWSVDRRDVAAKGGGRGSWGGREGVS